MKTPLNQCLDCGTPINAASDPLHGGLAPTPDDVTVCLKCGHVMGFNADLTVRPLTDAEIIKLAGNEDLLLIQKARSKLKTGENGD